MRSGLDIGDGAEQSFGIRVARTLEQIPGACLLHLPPGIHHDDAIGIFGDHPHVVGDQDDRGAEPILKFPHQVENLGLYRYVQRSGRLVGDQQSGIARNRHRYHDALTHPAGELMRVGMCPALGIGDMDTPEHLHRLFPGLAPRQALVQRYRFADLASHRQ